MNKKILTVLIVLCAIACNNTHPVISYYDTTTKVKKEEYLVNTKTGHKDGLYRSYYESGALKTEMIYKDGHIEDTVKKYYDDGKTIEEKSLYKNDQLNGTRTLYYPNGKVEQVEHYTDDKFDGPFVSFYEQGQKHEVGQFANEFRTGKWLLYYKDGRLKSEYLYNGKSNDENGPYKEYFKDGKIAEEGQMIEGDNDGPVTYYDSTGAINRIRIYANGRPLRDSLNKH